MFLDNFKVLATHPNKYGETEVLEMRIDLVLGAVPFKGSQRTFSESLGVTTRTSEEVGQRDKWVTDLRELNKQGFKDSYPS